MSPPANSLEARLLEDWQRGLPLVPRPFAAIAQALGACESDVITALRALQASGAMSRVGGVVRPNTLGASTLAAMTAPATSDVAETLVTRRTEL